jgi:hypothetical protein
MYINRSIYCKNRILKFNNLILIIDRMTSLQSKSPINENADPNSPLPAEDDVTENNLLLAITLPADAIAGSTFHVSVDTPDKKRRSFEVTVPEGNVPGEVINIVVPKDADISIESNTYFNTVDAVLAASKKEAIQQAKGLDDAFKVSERISNINDTYKISERVKWIAYYPQAIGSAAVGGIQTIDTKLGLSATVCGTITKVQDLEVSKKAVRIGGNNIAFAREVDTKLCVSATSARVVVGGVSYC